MKYWFFDGSDVLGPFTPQQLTAEKAFSAVSLVCPENFSDDGDHWQPAATFDELKPWIAPAEEPEDPAITLEQEMDSLLKEKSPLLFEESPTDGPGLQLPKKPAKPGPIEDYFNHIKEEDLGDILGIPDPNDDSDMDLAHALEKQLAKTSSTRRREREAEEEADLQTAQQLEAEIAEAQQTHHVATATEVFGPRTQRAPLASTAVEPPSATMPTVDLPSMPTLAPEPDLSQSTDTAQPQPAAALVTAPAEPEELLAPQAPQPDLPAPAPQPVEAEPPQPAIITQQEEIGIITDPVQQRAEKVEVNSVRARLHQTQEMKDLVRETQSAHVKQNAPWEYKALLALLVACVIIGGLLLAKPFHALSTQPPAPAAPATTAQELLAEPAHAAQTPRPPAAATPAPTQEQKALSIVQNYRLPGERGPLAAYLTRIYQSQLAQGYAAAWEAELLHKNTYIVKYRLTKTRKEPIIYIFQADVAAGKLTGALNNISLDLVGKIQQ